MYASTTNKIIELNCVAPPAPLWGKYRQICPDQGNENWPSGYLKEASG